MNTPPAGINLATRPFRRERAQVAARIAGCLLLTLSLLVLVVMVVRERRHASALRRTIAEERVQLERVASEQSRYQAVLGKPGNVDVFSESVFYNELIARRGVSWTRVFDDLGRVLPESVRLVSVRLPQVAAESEGGTNHVQLDMVVGASQPQAVLDLLRQLEASPLFGAATVLSQQPPAQNDPLFRYRVSVPYVQRF